MRIKTCRLCYKGNDKKNYDCRLNYDGSAKSMESDMVVQIVKDVKDQGTTLKAIVGDDDSTTVCSLKSDVIPE